MIPQESWLSGGLLLPSASLGWAVAHGAVQSVDLSGHLPAGVDVTGLFTVAEHRRMTRARYPNADVEVRASAYS